MLPSRRQKESDQGLECLSVASANATRLCHDFRIGPHPRVAITVVNAARADREPGSEAVLDLWRQAGYPLGNHTANHLNLERAPSFGDWRADVLAGEAAVASRMAGADWHWLRFANLAVGARRAEALAFLAERGYRVADVSVAFGDWYIPMPTRAASARETLPQSTP